VAEVEKRSQTSAGKTWAAEVSMPSADVVGRIEAFAMRTEWRGGCEIEFIRDRSGIDWLIDVNPRFPAYIHGVTICGLNLPGRLVAFAVGEETGRQDRFGGQFTRVVSEVAVRPDSYIPPITNTEASVSEAQKHPSFQPSLVGKRKKLGESSRPKRLEFSDRSSTLKSRPLPGARTRSIDRASIDASLKAIEDLLSEVSHQIRATPALSIKTDPQGFLAHAYLERGWYAEAISSTELAWAMKMGFDADRMILNGPAAASMALTSDRSVRYAFADSSVSLEALAKSSVNEALGVRIRPSKVPSRFGIDLTDYHSYISALDAIASIGMDGKFAAHLHLPADQIGPKAWLDCFDEVVCWAAAMRDETGVPISAIDIGGGWHMEDFGKIFLPLLKNEIIPRISGLGTGIELVFEPGKAVSADLAKYSANIVEVREQANLESLDILVDCSIADLPMTQYYAHKIEHFRDSRLLGVLSGGKDRVLGSICMEADVLATSVSFPAFPESGDQLIFSGAGAYNSSMAWPFAGGKTRD